MKREEFLKSDAVKTLALPRDNPFPAAAIESALASESAAAVRTACRAFMAAAARFYKVPEPKVRVLAARPFRSYETGAFELFGDYDPRTCVIRVWMRTAVQHRVTSFGTFFSTLCHELCHHLDLHLFGFRSTPHTRGFFERTAVLYHHSRRTPLRPLVWIPFGRARFRIDWSSVRKKT